MKHILPLLCLLVLVPRIAFSAVQLNGVFSDHMVLQRDMPVTVWGTAEPREKITVSFGVQKKETTANDTGEWSLKLDPIPASAVPETLSVRGSNEIAVKDVLVGEVWLCSGQSNMAMRMNAVRKNPIYLDDLASANFPTIRQGTVPLNPSTKPLATVPVTWAACDPATVKEFGAAAFYFARRLQSDLKVPIGLVLSSVGSTSAFFWTSKEALDTVPEFKTMAERELANAEQFEARSRAFPGELAVWEKANGRAAPPNAGEKAGWMNPEADTAGWQPAKAGAKWSDFGLPNGGVAWMRKEIFVAPEQAGKPLRLDFGRNLDQSFTLYWNGKKTEDFGSAAPGFTMAPAAVAISATEVKPGANLLAMRFVSPLGSQGPVAPNPPVGGGEPFVKIESAFQPSSPTALASRPQPPKDGRATTLFNGMIHPLIPFAIRGAVWYQGENDVSNATGYQKLLPLLIGGWRSLWSEGDFPFLIQQLPNYGGQGSNGKWAELREAQMKVAEKVPNAALSVGIDIGDSQNLHPANKRDIGTRLAVVALHRVYGKDMLCSGPSIEAASKGDDGVWRIKFHCAGTLKTLDGAAPRQFAVASTDRQFAEADAVIKGNEVTLSCAKVSRPEAVRYAWLNDPKGVNLTDDSGLPVRPFRTDDWPSEPVHPGE